MRSLRTLGFVIGVVFAAVPAHAAPISIVIGDKDGFGLGLNVGDDLPWMAPIQDLRSLGEQGALSGAQFTDLYAAIYDGIEPDCPLTGCSPNGAEATVHLSFPGQLIGANLIMFMGDFQSSQFGAILATINDISVPFAFDHGFHETALETIPLTPEMIAAANLAGEVTLYLDHRFSTTGSRDYVAFDYFELNGETAPVPEPGTCFLLGSGIAAFAARRMRRKRSA